MAANISGSLSCSDAEFWAPVDKPNRCAVELFRAKLGDVFLLRAKIHGGLYANGSEIARNLRLHGAEVQSREALDLKTGNDSAVGAVSLQGAVIDGGLYLSPKDPPERGGR